MIPRKVTLENFLSYGPEQTIHFEDNEPLWVVSGPNGVGKSAIFDAITYCLYAQHRGGGQGHEQLIRKGQNSFRVAFEFEFANKTYRVSRTYGKKPTQQVEELIESQWKRVPNVDGTKAVTEWVVKTIGLTFDAFTASVLLRQGKSDDILDATPTARAETLKKIIGVERFEQLSEAVSQARKGKSSELVNLQRKRQNLPGVSEEELHQSALRFQQARASRETADAARQAATAALPQARQWLNLNLRHRELQVRLVAAEQRRLHAEAIRRDHARLQELASVVPALQRLIPLRITLREAEHQRETTTALRDRLRGELEQTRNRVEALRLRAATTRQAAKDHADELARITDEQARQTTFLQQAQELDQLRGEANRYALTLAADMDAAQHAEATARHAELQAQNAVAEQSALLKQAEKQQRDFANVAIGVRCSQCGQPVTAEHAEAEQCRLSNRVRDLRAARAEAHDLAESQATRLREVIAQVQQLAAKLQQRDQAIQRLHDRERQIVAFGGSLDAAAIQLDLHRLQERQREVQSLHLSSRTEQQNVEAELHQIEPRMAQLGQQLQRAEADAIRWTTQTTLEQAQCEALLQQLPVAWHAFDDVSPLSVEFAQLQARNIPEEFHALQQEAILLEDWQRQARELEGELAAVPESCRVTVAQAEANLQLAEQAYRQAEADHREAEGQHSRFLQQIQDIQKLNEEIKQAEEAERLHKTLDQLLGKDGLQRELMREAEQAIISMAQQTLDHLSLGELSIALAETETGPDRAFDLAVRSGENTTPTSVKMLSGSQKFRVAISIALAIGRFASGQARPLECVIIDEGFGSLDKEGLRTTADELNRLKGLLKRIILVSHQDEFTERFPAMIRLSKGEQGTTAEAIRHRG